MNTRKNKHFKIQKLLLIIICIVALCFCLVSCDSDDTDAQKDNVPTSVIGTIIAAVIMFIGTFWYGVHKKSFTWKCVAIEIPSMAICAACIPWAYSLIPMFVIFIFSIAIECWHSASMKKEKAALTPYIDQLQIILHNYDKQNELLNGFCNEITKELRCKFRLDSTILYDKYATTSQWAYMAYLRKLSKYLYAHQTKYILQSTIDCLHTLRFFIYCSEKAYELGAIDEDTYNKFIKSYVYNGVIPD